MTIKTKKRFVPQVGEEFQSKENFAQLLEQANDNLVKEGTVVKGKVVGVDKDVAVIDVGLKNEGRVPLTEFTLSMNSQVPQIGDFVDVYVEKIEGRNGRTVLSREKAIREESWVILENASNKGEYVDGVIFGRVKGGFTVDLSGVVAFLPGSQVDVRPIKDMNPLMGIVQPFQILKMDKKLGNIVVSRRAILEESRSEARDEMLSQIKENMVLEGVVKNILDYGVFVDLGSVDGLLHVTDISWTRINHPSEVLSLGQRIKVMVIKYNEDTKRISLGMKQLDSNPWEGLEQELAVGKKMTGKVTNIADYGAFIELKPGIEGLVHTSEISWTKTNQHPRKLLNIGQEVEFVIIEVDSEKHRISLSIKQCTDNPWKAFAEKHNVGEVIKAPIRNITDFGLFVALGDEIDGMIHESDIAWTGNSQEALKSFKKGEEVECKVLAIDVEKERITLGMKQLTNDPYEGSFGSFNKGDSVKCKVLEVKDEGIEVELAEGLTAFIKKADLSSEKTEQKPERFSVDDEVEAKILAIDKQSRKVSLSIKALELDERKRVIKEYGSADSSSTLGDILGAALNQKDEK
ncbi:MAG: rpsA [Rickettsiaceae bacterium]|jgi:small subunit ribosomal protein S1|nr:rpsA [Rickettsiaceae bacterium]